MSPTVSVIIPCYNQGLYLHESISSSLANKYLHEIIVVDDGSTDPFTKRELENIKAIPKVKVFSQVNGGLSSARNKGLLKSTGSHIQFLDADDVISPKKFELQLDQNYHNYDLYISGYYTSDGMLFDLAEQLSCFNYAATLHNLVLKWERGYSIPIHCAIFSKQLLNNIYFDFSLKAKEDWVFWTQVFIKKPKIKYDIYPLAVYRVANHNMTRNRGAMGWYFKKATAKIRRYLSGDLLNQFDTESERWFSEFYQVASLPKTETRSTERPEFQYYDKWFFGDGVGDADRLIDIVIPAFGHIDYLEECIRSCCEAGKNYSVYLYDDHSPDIHRHYSLYAYLAKIYPNFSYFISSENSGICSSQQRLLDIGSAEYVVFVDCDDYISPDSIDFLANTIQAHRDVDYFYTDRYDINSNGNVLRVVSYGSDYSGFKPSYDIKVDILNSMFCTHMKCLKREVIVSFGGFQDCMEGVQDLEVALKFLVSGKRFWHINNALYFHRKHTTSITSARAAVMQRYSNTVYGKYFKQIFDDYRLSEEVILSLKKLLAESEDRFDAFHPKLFSDGALYDFKNYSYLSSGTIILSGLMDRWCLYNFKSKYCLVFYIPFNRDDLLLYIREAEHFFDYIFFSNDVHYMQAIPVVGDVSKLVLIRDLVPSSLFDDIYNLIDCH